MSDATKLLDEPALVILPSLATALESVSSAVVLQQIHFRARVGRDGWWRATIADLRKEFPFWSEATIKRVFAKLRREGLVEVHQVGTDRTNHYRVEYEALRGKVRRLAAQTDPLQGLRPSANGAGASAGSAPIPIGRKKTAKKEEGSASGKFDRVIRR